MAYGVQWIRSLFFNISMYLAMPVIGLIALPWMLVSTNGAYWACHAYCRWVQWSAGWMIGLKCEVRGTPPTGAALVAAKHQSFLDILMIFGAMPRGRFIMKKELMWAPILGLYAWRIKCVFVDRGKRGQAIAKMLADVAAGNRTMGQLTIYPQGTRVSPGVVAPYKAGTGILYEQLGQPCVPVACNVGVFWPKRGVYRKPGTAVVEFLEPIPPGVRRVDFMKLLQDRVESRSNALMAEAGFVALPKAKD
ncbi:lysophospholipid acyltransferase family protein [Oceaniglobus ichthyenteri]|uniref:lysophospholipid acyltransferase family protein n=1 Tax=Oceaniglobus ichthyenteri TaxID=2136177 RepID=UPI000D385AD2|nr:lysophospholipid acyltransferase family protein [Oceaniglobus ichthyenteri]